MATNDNLLYRLWGKTNERDRDASEKEWASHPAICHMVDVGYVAETWLRLNPWILKRFAIFAPEIEPELLVRIIIVIIALHDLGKVHVRFQSKSEKGWEKGYGGVGARRERDDGRGFDHGRGTACIMRELVRKEFREWKQWLPVIDAVAAHHGRFYEAHSLNASNNALYTSLSREMERPVAVEAVRTLSTLFGLSVEVPPPPRNGAFSMLLAGFCSIADWFGSNSEVFEFTEVNDFPGLERYLHDLRESGKADRLLRDAGLLPRFSDAPPTYFSLFDFLKSPDDLRPLQAIARDVPFGREPGSELVVVEAPMGMGKTELALYLASQAIHHDTADGIYFALPTQASSNALLDRIESFAERIAAPGSSLSLVLAHGSRRFNKSYQHLQKNFRDLQYQFERSRERGSRYGDDNGAPSEVVAPSWLQSSKRSLLATVGVGTIDQAMLGAISVKHAFVRLFALSGKVVIFDEIHAYDSYMNVVIVRLLNWLHALGAKVLLLSATLSRTLRNDLLSAFGGSPTTDGTATPDPYPQLIYLRGATPAPPYTIDAPVTADVEAAPDKVVHVAPYVVGQVERTRAGAELAMDLARRGGCIAWIRNTVREAQEAWRTILELAAGTDIRVVSLHARYIRNDRNEIEEELVRILGKHGGADRPERIIVVATQVIEQSVDLDFDAMISDLAPADLLLQRAGRLWRHEARSVEERHGHERPVLHVLMPDDEERREMAFGASAYVYDPDTLSRSAWVVRDRPEWRMPGVCRELIEIVYDREEGFWTAERLEVDEEKLEKARRRREMVESRMEQTATSILMQRPGRSTAEMEYAHSDDDRGGNVALATRYGGSSATVVLLRECQEGMCLLGNRDLPIVSLPDASNYRGILEIEEAVERSSVSFPWYSALASGELPDDAQRLASWWRERHPYDNKVFLVVDSNGAFDHPAFVGRYEYDASDLPREGLVIERKAKREASLVVYEEL